MEIARERKLGVTVNAVSKVLEAGTTRALTGLDKVSVTIGDNEFFTLLRPS